MTNSMRIIRRGLAVTLLLSGMSIADDARELTWDDLIPDAGTTEQPGGLQLGADGNLIGDEPLLSPMYATDVVRELDGALVKIPGFVVPLEVSEEGKVSEFLLVPYFGACIHFPPPPANQIVYITVEDPIDLESTWEPIWATGELKTEFRETGLAYAGYTMAAQTTEQYEY